MLAALLPISSAPMSCSRAATRRLTIPAWRLPPFASRIMAARDATVSAVSLPENRNDITRQTTTATMMMMSAVVIVCELCAQKCAHVLGIDVRRDERAADAARKNEGELAALDLLVLGDEVHQRIDRRSV